jgi:hypothetical protein
LRKSNSIDAKKGDAPRLPHEGQNQENPLIYKKKVVDSAVCCEPVSVPNSLINRENTGKDIDFLHNLGATRSETAAATDAFFRNSLKWETGNYF